MTESTVKLHKVRRERCDQHGWKGDGECPHCVAVWAWQLASFTVPQDTAYDRETSGEGNPNG